MKNITKHPAKLMSISINMEATGANIKRLIKASGYSIEEIMVITGVSTPQAVYKWMSGKSLPSQENSLILCKLFGVTIDELWVIDGYL